MKKSPTTSERILDASRRLFNEKGYAATTLTEIASAVGISQGNLTYHFPTKRDLVTRLQEQARARIRARRNAYQAGTVADDYIEQLLFSMELTWNHRFLLRDRVQFAGDDAVATSNPQMAEDLEALRKLLDRIEKAGYFRKDLPIDIAALSRALWIVSRYWMDHLREMEGRIEITWADQKRGLHHHLAVLLPCLTVSARRQFEAAVQRATSQLANDIQAAV